MLANGKRNEQHNSDIKKTAYRAPKSDLDGSLIEHGKVEVIRVLAIALLGCRSEAASIGQLAEISSVNQPLKKVRLTRLFRTFSC